MNAVEAANYTAQAVLLFVALYVAWTTLRRPTRSNLWVLFFFSLFVVVIAYSIVEQVFAIAPSPVADILPALLVLMIPYVLLRLAWQFSHVRPRVLRAAEVGLVISWAFILYPGTENPLILLLLVTYFAAVSIYAASQFQAGSAEANGITQKRLRAMSLASIVLGAALFSVVLTAVIEGPLSSVIEVTRQAMLVAAGLLYLVGFAPPQTVRRSWQEPEIRQFFQQTLNLPSWTSTDDLLRHVARVTAETVGAPHAVIGLWNEETGTVDFPSRSFAPGESIGGKAFVENRPILSLDTVRDDPESRELYEMSDAYAVMAAPFSAEGRPTGVIALYSPNPPMFAHDDLRLLSLLADQIGIILENRRFVQAQAELAAREETARLKDEFLSVAAHDLKTPLTTILATGQHLERRLDRLDGEAPERRAVSRLNRETRRLWALVEGLLDASRIERGELVTHVVETDLGQLIAETIERTEGYATHQIQADLDADIVCDVDPVRMQQVIENLLENARKFSPKGSLVTISVKHFENEIRISVSDQGAGIAEEDRERVFDRYFRTTSSENGVEPGIGLGLYICKEIVDQHGGRIWVESELGEGTTFHVSLIPGRITAEEHDTANSRS